MSKRDELISGLVAERSQMMADLEAIENAIRALGGEVVATHRPRTGSLPVVVPTPQEAEAEELERLRTLTPGSAAAAAVVGDKVPYGDIAEWMLSEGIFTNMALYTHFNRGNEWGNKVLHRFRDKKWVNSEGDLHEWIGGSDIKRLLEGKRPKIERRPKDETDKLVYDFLSALPPGKFTAKMLTDHFKLSRSWTDKVIKRQIAANAVKIVFRPSMTERSKKSAENEYEFIGEKSTEPAELTRRQEKAAERKAVTNGNGHPSRGAPVAGTGAQKISTNKDIDALVKRLVKEQGFTWKKSSENHIIVIAPGGGSVSISNTPSDWRAMKKYILKDLRKIGAQV